MGHGPATVRKINEVLKLGGRHWAYTTVANLLQGLDVKQYAASDQSVAPHVLRTCQPRRALKRRLKDAAEKLCGSPAAPLVLALVQGNRFSAVELTRLRCLLGEAVGGLSPPSKSKP